MRSLRSGAHSNHRADTQLREIMGALRLSTGASRHLLVESTRAGKVVIIVFVPRESSRAACRFRDALPCTNVRTARWPARSRSPVPPHDGVLDARTKRV